MIWSHNSMAWFVALPFINSESGVSSPKKTWLDTLRYTRHTHTHTHTEYTTVKASASEGGSAANQSHSLRHGPGPVSHFIFLL